MFTFIPDRASKTPMYEQLYKFIRTGIENADIASGEKMPSKRKLSAHLKISQTTVESAYSQLTAEGYLKAVPKSGFYVSRLESCVFSGKISTPAQEIAESAPKAEYKYDFKTNAVSLDLFPFSTWSSIGRGVLR